MTRHVRWILPVAALAMAIGGCGAAPAALELIAQAQKGLDQARRAQQAQHEQIVAQMESQSVALDDAFDRDVRLVEAGKITDSSGRPVEFDAEWVISARRGYAAARDVLGEQINRQQASHEDDADNLDAADEALEMAAELIVYQSSLTGRLKQRLLDIYGRLTQGK